MSHFYDGVAAMLRMGAERYGYEYELPVEVGVKFEPGVVY
jgi:hypothetical protein